MSGEKPPAAEFFPMDPGEEEALLFSIRCFTANITAAEFDAMSAPAREWLRTMIGMNEAQFHAACVYLADYRSKYSYGLRLLRAGLDYDAMTEPCVERLQ